MIVDLRVGEVGQPANVVGVEVGDDDVLDLGCVDSGPGQRGASCTIHGRRRGVTIKSIRPSARGRDESITITGIYHYPSFCRMFDRQEYSMEAHASPASTVHQGQQLPAIAAIEKARLGTTELQ